MVVKNQSFGNPLRKIYIWLIKIREELEKDRLGGQPYHLPIMSGRLWSSGFSQRATGRTEAAG